VNCAPSIRAKLLPLQEIIRSRAWRAIVFARALSRTSKLLVQQIIIVRDAFDTLIEDGKVIGNAKSLSLLKTLYGPQIGFSSEDCSLILHR
jgi:hypothetical protein